MNESDFIEVKPRQRYKHPTFRIDKAQARIYFNNRTHFALRFCPSVIAKVHKSRPELYVIESWDKDTGHRLFVNDRKTPWVNSVDLVETLLARGFERDVLYAGKKHKVGVLFSKDDRDNDTAAAAVR